MARRMLTATIGVLLGLGLIGPGLPVFADTVDPEVLHIGTGLGTPCQSGGCFVFGTEVNGLGAGGTIDIWENGGGQPTLASPLLLILGVVNDTGTFAAPSITLSSGTGTLGGTNVYGGSWNTSTGFADIFNSANGAAVYTSFGLNDGSSSESFVNWSGAESSVLGITATQFGIYVYTLSNTGITGNSGVDVTFGGALPVGTFIVAYGCGVSETPNNPCPSGGKGGNQIFATPFTQSGLTQTQVPEPGTLALFGTGILGLAGLIRQVGRKGKRSQSEPH